MSKSIYEELLEKIDEHIEVMKKAQKQEKLLELYRVYIRELENMNSIYNAEICEHVKLYHIKDGMLDKYNDTTNKILKEINEIEDEIKGDRK